MTEAADTRLKRMRLRSWRRGTKEMDLILGGFADDSLATLDDGEIALYDRLLEENDHDLYRWVSGQAVPPEPFGPLLGRIAAHVARTGGAGRD